jgi:competence protein ComEC
MGSLAYFGQVLGRRADGLRLLIAAVMLMLAYEPMLIFDVGFQLSVGATTGLLLLGPWLGKLFNRVWLVGGDIRDSLAAQIAVWPILLITFGNLSVFAVLINGLILWLVPVIMGLGAVLAVAGVVWRPLGQVMGWVVYGPLTLMVRMIEWFGAKEWMNLVVEGVSWWWGWGYYLVLGGLLIKFYKYNRKNVK